MFFFFFPFQLLRFRVRFITQHPHVTTNAQFAVDRTLKHPLFDALLQTSTKKNGVLAEGAYVKNICSPTLYIKSF